MPAYFEDGFFAREPAWHGLGTVIPDPVPSEEALILSKLDWQVELRPKYLSGETETLFRFNDQIDDFEEVEVTHVGRQVDKDFSVVRVSDGQILGRSVGAVYRPIQNLDGFKFLDSLVEEDSIMYESAGSLHGGSKVWMLARVLGEPYQVMGVDPLYQYMLATNSHDGQSSFRVFPTAVRVVCANTLSLALGKGKGKGISIRHSGDIEAKIVEAHNVFKETNTRFKRFCEQAELLARHNMTVEEMDSFIESIYPSKSEEPSRQVQAYRNQFREEFEEGDGEYTVQEVVDTAWEAFNTVTRITNHIRKPKMSTGVEKTGEAYNAARFDSLFFGNSNDLNQRALLYLTTLASGRDPSNILRA